MQNKCEMGTMCQELALNSPKLHSQPQPGGEPQSQAPFQHTKGPRVRKKIIFGHSLLLLAYYPSLS